MRASILFFALLTGGVSALEREGLAPSFDIDLSLELSIPLASPIADSELEAFGFGGGSSPLALRVSDVFEVPRFFQPMGCGYQEIPAQPIRNPMTVERVEAFWVPITGQVDSVLVIDYYDLPRRTRTGF